MRALIVEDTDSVRYALQLALEFLGHEVVGVASDGYQALQQYDATRPDFVMMDVRMPGMDGLATTTRLLSDHDPHARVVIVTAGRSTEVDAEGVGACGFVEKPFALDQLGKAIHGVG